ncbi:hypothetical protein BH10ACI2_BH10ACI2_15490 [soil metagenome]
MRILVDTNILTALSQRQSPHFTSLRQTLSRLLKQGDVPCIAAQNLIEYWTVATRPIDVNGLGLDFHASLIELEKFKRYFEFIPTTAETYLQWEKLMAKYQVKGKQSHDTYLVAAMMEHRISRILTFNSKDFRRFDEINVIDPRNT